MSINNYLKAICLVNYFSRVDKQLKAAFYHNPGSHRLATNWSRRSDGEFCLAVMANESIEFFICSKGRSLWLNYYLLDVEDPQVAIVLANQLTSDCRQGVVNVALDPWGTSLWYHVPAGSLWKPKSIKCLIEKIKTEMYQFQQVITEITSGVLNEQAIQEEFLVDGEV